jgi:hypothetical protein
MEFFGLTLPYTLLFYTHLVLYSIGIAITLPKGGLKHNIFFLFILFIFFIYLTVTPALFYYSGYKGIFGTDCRIGHHYEEAAFMYAINIFFVIIGYVMLPNKIARQRQPVIHTTYDASTKAQILFFVFYSIVILNLALGGESIFQLLTFQYEAEVNEKGQAELVLMGNHDVGFSNYLANFADAIITTLLGCFIFKTPRWRMIGLTLIALLLFSMLGFRYRTLLTLFGFFIIYVLMSEVTMGRILSYVFIGSTMLYVMLFLTANRWEIASAQWDKVSYDVTKMDYFYMISQTRASMADMAVLRNFDRHPELPYEGGSIMFLTPIIRLTPSFIYPGGKKPYPDEGPYSGSTTLYTITRHSKGAGEAISMLGTFYLSFGYAGIVFFAFLLGFFAKIIQNGLRLNSPYSILFYTLFCLGFFQSFTRGNTGEALDHFGFLMLGYLALRIWRNMPLKNNIEGVIMKVPHIPSSQYEPIQWRNLIWNPERTRKLKAFIIEYL